VAETVRWFRKSSRIQHRSLVFWSEGDARPEAGMDEQIAADLDPALEGAEEIGYGPGECALTTAESSS
jgi:hypothetical protein